MRLTRVLLLVTIPLVPVALGFSLAARGQATRPATQPAQKAMSYAHDVKPLLATYCLSCHSGAEPKGDVHLDFADEDAALAVRKIDDGFWQRVSTELTSARMPPARARVKPTDAERNLLVHWVHGTMLAASEQADPGPFAIHRLSTREYANTVRDLLYLPADFNPAADFPPDERGDGFDNNSATLTISPILIEHYLESAEKSVTKAFAPVVNARNDQTLGSKSKLNAPSSQFKEDFSNRQAKVRLNIEVFAPRAYRRPVSKEEIDELMKFAALSFAHDGESFDKATGLVIRACLMSPEFLFRMERDPAPDGTNKIYQLTDYQLASRMSYFLWSSMPDDELFTQCKDGKLRGDLEQQVVRMMKDPKGASLTKDFLGQWLEIRSLEKIPNCPPGLLASMKEETEHFFNYILQEDRSIMDFLDADYTFVNEQLAKHYGIPGVTGPEFQKVQVDADQRGGIFTQGSFLVLTAKPLEVQGSSPTLRTSPVNRGKWILENIFAETIPPPPPNVPALPFDTNKELKGTVRQIFEQHRVDATCASCHARMDPYGFALENYDGFGAWRKKDNNLDIDCSGEINGRKFTTPREFRTILATRKDDFRRAFVQKMLSYALGRGIQSYDKPAVDGICEAVEKDGDRISSVIHNIIRSYPFDHARGGIKSDVAADASKPSPAPATPQAH